MSRFRIRVVSPWFGSLETEEAIFSTAIASDDADALLCDWAPSAELFSFPRRKAWYCCEPWHQFRSLHGGTWPKLRARLRDDEFLSHNHPDPRYRVPHVTHFETLSVNNSTDRLEKAVAIVSNFGGGPWRRNADMSNRNRFITNENVDLYGRDGWGSYRRGLLSRPGYPSNYRGEISGDWPAGEKRRVLGRYKVSVCMENMNEPRYFTEKFVEAVCAGCIPVYKPDTETLGTVLQGAFWVDPRDHDNDPTATIAAALAADLTLAQNENRAWVNSNADLTMSSHTAVFQRIGRILCGLEDRDSV